VAHKPAWDDQELHRVWAPLPFQLRSQGLFRQDHGPASVSGSPGGLLLAVRSPLHTLINTTNNKQLVEHIWFKPDMAWWRLRPMTSSTWSGRGGTTPSRSRSELKSNPTLGRVEQSSITCSFLCSMEAGGIKRSLFILALECIDSLLKHWRVQVSSLQQCPSQCIAIHR